MKSYFAKLAARATLSNAPVPSSVPTSTTQDPFESASGFDAASSPRSFAQPTNSFDSLRSSRSHSLMRSDVNSRSRSEETSSQGTQQNEEQSDSISDSTPLVPNVQPPPQLSRELTPVAQEAVSHRESRQSKPESNDAPAQLVKQESDISSLAPPTTTREIREPKPTSEARTEEGLSELKHDQSVLQRKADAFMAQLFERRSKATQQEPDNDEEERRPPKPALREEPSRLQPAPKMAALKEVADEQPSLVIGKLTVEVTSATTRTVTPPRQVVVVRGRGTARRGGVPSSQRFGLGQF